MCVERVAAETGLKLRLTSLARPKLCRGIAMVKEALVQCPRSGSTQQTTVPRLETSLSNFPLGSFSPCRVGTISPHQGLSVSLPLCPASKRSKLSSHNLLAKPVSLTFQSTKSTRLDKSAKHSANLKRMVFHPIKWPISSPVF